MLGLIPDFEKGIDLDMDDFLVLEKEDEMRKNEVGDGQALRRAIEFRMRDGRRITAFRNWNTPSTAIPRRRKGRRRSQMIG
jgi:hypothetical protein